MIIGEIELKYKDNPAPVSVKGGFLNRHTAFASEYIATFDNGSIRFSTLQPGVVNIGTDTDPEMIEVKGDGYANELDYFSECIMTRKPPEKCLPETSMQAIEICWKLKQISQG